MEALIAHLEHTKNYKDGLRVTCKANCIPAAVLGGLTFKKMRMFSQRTLKQYNRIKTVMRPILSRPQPTGSKMNYVSTTGC